MATIELPETKKVSPALIILGDEWGWQHEGDEAKSRDKRIVRFRDNEYEIFTETCLTDYPPIEELTITFHNPFREQERALREIVQQSLEVSWESSNYILNSLFDEAVLGCFRELFPKGVLRQVAGTRSFETGYRSFDEYELSEDVADVLHSFKNAVLNNHQRSLQKYLDESAEFVKEDR